MARKENPSAGSFLGGVAVGFLLGAVGMAWYKSTRPNNEDPNALPTTNQFSPYRPREIT